MVRNYTIVDDMKIINYIILNKLYTQVKGRKMWQEMAAAGILDRSWHSLKQRYNHKILNCLNDYNLSTIERTRLSSGKSKQKIISTIKTSPTSKMTTNKYFSDSSNDSSSERAISTLEAKFHPTRTYSTRKTKNFDAPANMAQIEMSDDPEVENDRLNESPASMCKKNNPKGSGGVLNKTRVEPPGQPDQPPNYLIKLSVNDRTILFVPKSISNRDLQQIRQRYSYDIVLLNVKDYNVAFARKWYNTYFSKLFGEDCNNLINKYMPRQTAGANLCEAGKRVLMDAHDNLIAELMLVTLDGEASPQPSHSSSQLPASSVLPVKIPAPATSQADNSSDEDLFPEYKFNLSAEKIKLEDFSQELRVNKHSTKHIRVYSKRRCNSAGGSSAAPPNGPGGSTAPRATPPERQIDLCDDPVIKEEVDADQMLSLEPEGPGESSYLSYSSLTSCETFFSAVAQSQESTASQCMASHSPESAQSALQLLQGLRSAGPASQ